MYKWLLISNGVIKLFIVLGKYTRDLMTYKSSILITRRTGCLNEHRLKYTVHKTDPAWNCPEVG